MNNYSHGPWRLPNRRHGEVYRMLPWNPKLGKGLLIQLQKKQRLLRDATLMRSQKAFGSLRRAPQTQIKRIFYEILNLVLFI
jgi:hypothetical protein